jgi:hypothetical protein
MDHIHQEIDLDTDSLRARLYRLWMNMPKIGQGQLARDIGIAEFSLRLFLDKNVTRRFTRRTKMKIYKWIVNQEGKHNVLG